MSTSRSPKPEADTADARLLALVDHDLRSPLLNLSMAVNLLAQGEPSADLNADLARIMSESIDRLGLLTRDLLAFAHVRLGTHAPLEPREVDLAVTIRTALAELTPSFPNHVLDVTPAEDARGSFDPVRIVQLVRTFLGLALRCAPPRSTVAITTHASPSGLTVEARIPGSALVGERGGEAGLHLVQQLATLHGATVQVIPAADGATFTLQLPRAAAE